MEGVGRACVGSGEGRVGSVLVGTWGGDRACGQETLCGFSSAAEFATLEEERRGGFGATRGLWDGLRSSFSGGSEGAQRVLCRVM